MHLDNRTCKSTDPCEYSNGGCEHECRNEAGKAVCSCQTGFELLDDGKLCRDVDECASLNHGCPHKCVNTIGSFKCDCHSGYEINDQGICIDINECATYNGGCSAQSKCINMAGSFRCVCPGGFKLAKDRRTCIGMVVAVIKLVGLPLRVLCLFCFFLQK